ncbi:MAG: tetratricopeptide repeat protein [Deltaproteobacteria bacterium]
MSEKNNQRKTNWGDKIDSFNLEELLLRLIEKARDFIDEQNKYIVYGVIGVLSIAIAWGGWHWYSKKYEVNATNYYMAIQQKITSNPNIPQQEMIAMLKDVVAKYPRSRVAGVANYGLGNIYYFSGNFDGAISAYGEFVDRASGDDDLAVISCISMGFSYEAKKDYQNALLSYQKAEKMKSGANFASTNLQNIARIYDISGDRTKATEYYKLALEKATEPIAKRIIQNKIGMLNQ